MAAWLERHPRVRFHFTPTSASWLTSERFFSERLAVEQREATADTITAYIENRNRDPAPFKWTAAARNPGESEPCECHFSDTTLVGYLRVAVDRAGGESRQADGDIFRPRRARRAVADPLTRVRHDRLASLDFQNAALVLDA